ncbi:MAG: PLDc_N domain-containing protein [Rhodococcus sp.]|uniref:PLD nuclease N-terminal domain-containing protein n=1 Tax=Rhodococcus TaxID=1827 RepID=UPI00169F83D8|nr:MULTISPECIES: PLD nuclease N-terminal domain-containing protein [Rhodococcus]NLV78593.1 PLDc_N domain-containing protein [Rhodococcus sp. (in: high G+C Gram-positive bacteria)]
MPYLGLITMVLWVICLVDVICADEHRIRHLPKMMWVMIVLLIPLVGSVLWLVIGRPPGSLPGTARSTSAYPEHDRPNRHVAQYAEDDEEFLRRCRARAEEQRRIAREQQRRRDAEGS